MMNSFCLKSLVNISLCFLLSIFSSSFPVHPVRIVHQYRRGFARFTNSRYSSKVEDIYDGFMHLTNVAIQKKNSDYDLRTGGKMELQGVISLSLSLSLSACARASISAHSCLLGYEL